jgi:predicted metal-dependent phosphoesterase TrpH
VTVIPGIEISAYDFTRNRRVHILGYGIEPGHPALEQLCSPIVTRRHQASIEMVKRLQEAGYQISWERVEEIAEGGTGVYKQHIMHALIEQGYTDSIYGSLYKTLFSRGGSDRQTGIAYIPMEYVDAAQAIQAVRVAGGVAVLAHPGQYESFEVVPELVRAGLQGIEVWHPLHGPEEERRAQQLAVEYGLFQTGGSDFHGFYGEVEVQIGSNSPAPNYFETLLRYIQKKFNQKEI